MTPTTTRTLRLVERRPRLARLAPDEVSYLLAHHRPHIDLAPTATRHLWQIRSHGVAGVLFTPRRRIVIAPKVALQTLLFLADPTLAEVGGTDTIEPADGASFLDLLAGLLAAQMLERVRAGLQRGYRQSATLGPFLIGSFDLAAQLRQTPFRKDQIHGRHDDFTAELPCNQVPRRLAPLLLPLVGPTVRAALEQSIAAFAELSDGPFSTDLLAALDGPDTPDDYRSLLELCRLLADALGPSLTAGTIPAPALLVSLERLFERHVTRGVVEALPGVSIQPTHKIIGPPELLFRPDVVVERQGKPVLVVDAKWKRWPREAMLNEDVYQILAYCALLGCGRGVLVYPGRRKAWRHVCASGIEIEVRTLDVSGSPAECVKARQRMGRALTRSIG